MRIRSILLLFTTALVQGASFSVESSSVFRRGRIIAKLPRGGKAQAACADPGSVVLVKQGLATVVQGAGLVALLKGAQRLAEIDKVPGLLKRVDGRLSVLEWVASCIVVFSSTAVRVLVDGGLSTSTGQFLKPNVVPGDPNWYSALKKPWFNPPGWVFPIMWLIVSKPTQLWGLSRVLKTANLAQLTVYCTSLALGDTWNQVFFGCQRIRLGSIVIASFYAMLIASSVVFGSIDKKAGLLLLPTIGWVTVASALNFAIDRLNLK